MLGRLVASALESLLSLWALATFVFVAVHVVPGDPTSLVLGDQASLAERAALRTTLHLNESLLVQYARFCGHVVTFNFGDSLRRPGVSSQSRVLEALGPTAELALLSVLLGAVLGITLAVLATGPFLGKYRRWVERFTDLLAATPLLVVAPLLTLVLAVKWRVVPLPGDPDARFVGLLFSASLLAVPLGAQVARFGTAALHSLARAQFLLVAAAKGASPLRVSLVHGVAAASGPFLIVTASQLGALLGGAVVLERLFERPGLGSLILGAYAARDLPVLEGAVMAAGVLFVLVQIFASTLHTAIDPRARA